MCADAHIPSSSRQALVLAVRNVFVAIWINILLCKTKVNYKYRIPFRAGGAANEEILGLNVTIDEQLGVNILHTLNLQHIQQRLLMFNVLTASLLWTAWLTSWTCILPVHKTNHQMQTPIFKHLRQFSHKNFNYFKLCCILWSRSVISAAKLQTFLRHYTRMVSLKKVM